MNLNLFLVLNQKYGMEKSKPKANSSKTSIQKFKCLVSKCRYSAFSEKSLITHQLEHLRKEFLSIIEPHGFSIEMDKLKIYLKDKTKFLIKDCCFPMCNYKFLSEPDIEQYIDHLEEHHISSYIFHPCYNCFQIFNTKQKLNHHFQLYPICKFNMKKYFINNSFNDDQLNYLDIDLNEKKSKLIRCKYCTDSPYYTDCKLFNLHMNLLHSNKKPCDYNEELLLFDYSYDSNFKLKTKFSTTTLDSNISDIGLEPIDESLSYALNDDHDYNIRPVLEKVQENSLIQIVDDHDISNGNIYRKHLFFIINSFLEYQTNSMFQKSIENSVKLQGEFFFKNANLDKNHDDQTRADCPSLRNGSTEMGNNEKHNLKQLMNLYIFECSLCNYSFRSEKELSTHYYHVHNLPSYHCIHCNFITQDSGKYQRHELTHQSVEQNMVKTSFVCTICSESFNSNNDLEHHLNRNHRKFHCEICKIDMPNRHLLSSHMISFHRDAFFKYVEGLECLIV